MLAPEPDLCWQVLDKSVRDRIPNTVRWFTTLAQLKHFASAWARSAWLQAICSRRR